MPRKRKGQRADGLYQCKRKMPDGKVKVFYGHTKTEAEAKYLEAIAKKKKKTEDTDKFEVAAAEYWEALMKRIKEGTDSTYRSNWLRCVEAFKGRRMDEITKQMVEAFGEQLKNEGLSTSTIRNTRSVLNGIFKQWRIKTNASYDPIQDTRTAEGKPAVARLPPTEKELATFRAHPDGFGLTAWVLMYTGCRLGEAVALQWDDIDFDANFVHVSKEVTWKKGVHIRTPKTKNAVRDIPLMPRLKELLLTRRGKPGEYVIGGMTRPLTDAEYHQKWLMYCTKLGLVVPSDGRTRYRDKRYSKRKPKKPKEPVMKASVTAHQFRHSFATDLYDAGVGVLEAQKIMGHADISTTYKVYTHIRERKLEGAAQKLIAFYDGAESAEKDLQIFQTKSSKKVVK